MTSANEPNEDNDHRAAGHPRLVVAMDGHAVAGGPEAAGIQRGFSLNKDVITIGSSETQDIQIPGAEPEHGVLRWDADDDEWMYSDVGGSGVARDDGLLARSTGLHHGDRLDVGGVTLVFQRDEAADHGRPEGGRQGGGFAGGRTGSGGGDASEVS